MKVGNTTDFVGSNESVKFSKIAFSYEKRTSFHIKDLEQFISKAHQLATYVFEMLLISI